jgi:hypothetical protein
MFFAVIMAVGLVVTAAIMMRAHWRTWKSLQRHDVPPERHRFGRRQFRRRTTASMLMGMIGIAVLASPAMQNPHLIRYWLFWCGMLVLVMSMCWLALVDAVDTVRYFRAVHSSLLAKHRSNLDDAEDRSSSAVIDRPGRHP